MLLLLLFLLMLLMLLMLNVTLYYITVIYSGLSTRLLNHYHTRCTELETENS